MMKKLAISLIAIIAASILFACGFVLGTRYSNKSTLEHFLSDDVGIKLSILQLLRENKKADATLFLERELAVQLAALQGLQKQRFLTSPTLEVSRIERIRGATYFTAFPRQENASKVVSSLLTDLRSSDTTAALAEDSFFSSLKDRAKAEDLLFAEMMHEFSPSSSDFAKLYQYEPYYRMLKYYKSLNNKAEQDAAANP